MASVQVQYQTIARRAALLATRGAIIGDAVLEDKALALLNYCLQQLRRGQRVQLKRASR